MTQITQDQNPADTADPPPDAAPPPAQPPANPDPVAEESKHINFESLAIAGFIFGLFAMVVAVFAVGMAARAVNQSGGGGGEGGGSTGGGDAPTELAVELGDFFIDPAEGAIAEGGTIELTNSGAVAHDLVIGEQASDMLDPGATGTMTVEVEAGTYDWYCSVPGHREAGMEGTVTVG